MACGRAGLTAFLALLVASCAGAASAGCLAGACPGSRAPSLLQVGGSHERIGTGSLTPQRLHVLTVTGPGEHERFAIQAWEHQKVYLGPHDNYTHICEPGCGRLAVHGRFLTHVLPITDDAFPSGSCTGPDGGACAGYELSQMKWAWGLIHEWRARRSAGRPLPQWWLLKDDDTYLRADRLMDLVSGIDPTKERAIVGNRPDPPVHVEGPWCTTQHGPASWDGGTGILLSAALVEAVVTQHAEQWLRLQEEQIQQRCPFYDQHIGTVVHWVDAVREHSHSSEFRQEYAFNGAPSWIGEASVTYHMELARKALGDEAALAMVSKLFS